MRKSFKKVVAVTMAAAMVLGSNVVVFADDATGADGDGVNTGHLNTNVVEAVLPTTTAVADVFDFTIDPEDILSKADKFTDGTTAAGASFANEDLVYFKQKTGATKAYDSTSQAVSIQAKNYVAADVSVSVTVAEAADGKTTIPLVEDEDALDDATEPSLLLTLKVGTKTAAITEDGATVADTIAAQNAKFDVKRQSDGSYKVEPKTDSGIEWSGKDVQLSGKVKGGDVDSTIAAPNVSLTWTVAAHVDSYLSGTTLTASNRSLTMSLPEGVSIASVVLTHADGSAPITLTDQYTATSTAFSIPADNITAWLGLSPAYNKVVVNFSDETSETITLQ